MREVVKEMLQKELNALEASTTLKEALLETYNSMSFMGAEVEQVTQKKAQLEKDIEINRKYIEMIQKKITISVTDAEVVESKDTAIPVAKDTAKT